ncbi:hypothetical protein [Acidicapsa ligni]|uniref:hypothetical protein n=1 Tax=Acidicapsa ligni TaxID=542300 RepID=UPI0021DFADC2|nr:hypothetical protein [Acidicapsa ligni]
MNGTLSQATSNLKAIQQQIDALNDLPSDAHSVQSLVSTTISGMFPPILAMQNQVVAYVQISNPQLKELESLVSKKASLVELQPIIDLLKNKTTDLKGSISALTNQVGTLSAGLPDCISKLSVIESRLANENSQLQATLNDVQSKEAAAKKKYYYLLALGPLGLLGLAAALAVHSKLKSDVNEYWPDRSFVPVGLLV